MKYALPSTMVTRLIDLYCTLALSPSPVSLFRIWTILTAGCPERKKLLASSSMNLDLLSFCDDDNTLLASSGGVILDSIGLTFLAETIILPALSGDSITAPLCVMFPSFIDQSEGYQILKSLSGLV